MPSFAWEIDSSEGGHPDFGKLGGWEELIFEMRETT
jgi:hypothetical protein